MNKKIAILTAGLFIGTAAQAASGYVSQTTGSISIAPRDNLIIATTVVNWDTRASDVLAVKWSAPKGSFCRNSEFILTRGNNTANDTSWAYRTVIHPAVKGGSNICSGYWTANIVNINTHKVLASAGYNVAAPVDSASSGSASSSSSS